MHKSILIVFLMSIAVIDLAIGETMRFSSFHAPNLTPIAELRVREAYSQLGIDIELVPASPRRALLAAANGETDGELVRVADVARDFRTLKKVNVPLVTTNTYAFAQKIELQGKPIGTLHNYRVGHVYGARYAAALAKGFREVWLADTPEQLFDMLLIDRIDLVIVGEETGTKIIAARNLETVFPIEPPLATVRFYHYLHERHEALLPKVEEALRKVMEPLNAKERDGGIKRRGLHYSPAPNDLHHVSW